MAGADFFGSVGAYDLFDSVGTCALFCSVGTSLFSADDYDANALTSHGLS